MLGRREKIQQLLSSSVHHCLWCSTVGANKWSEAFGLRGAADRPYSSSRDVTMRLLKTEEGTCNHGLWSCFKFVCVCKYLSYIILTFLYEPVSRTLFWEYRAPGTCMAVQPFFFIWRNSPQWARATLFTRFLYHTERRTTVGRTPLNEWSARRRDLYMTIHNTHNRHPCPPRDSNPEFQQAPQTYVLDRAASGTGLQPFTSWNYGNRITLFYTLQTPVVCLSSSDGFHLDAVKIKETDRDGLLVTLVGRGLACN
jgi:hypothetical protein